MALKAGLHDIPVEDYHKDPCPKPSLSASGIHKILELSPAHFAASHPRLTQWPEMARESTKAQDLGTVIHALVLEKGAKYEVIPGFDDWRQKAAQNARQNAIEAGFIPLLQHTFDQANEVAQRLHDALVARYGMWPIGESEVTMIWQREDSDNNPIWCRGMIDHWSKERALIIDLKTTGRVMSDRELAAKIAGDGNDLQHAFYLDGIGTLFPDLAGVAEFVFAFAEVEPPYSIRFIRLPEMWRTLAGQRIDRAVDIFSECLRKNEWPAFRSEATLEIPTWRQNSFLTAELLEAM